MKRRTREDPVDSARRHYHRQLALHRATTGATDKTRCCHSTATDPRTGELIHKRECPVVALVMR